MQLNLFSLAVSRTLVFAALSRKLSPHAIKFASCALATVLASACVLGCSTPGKLKAKDEADLRINIGTAHLKEGNYPAALRELLKAEELDPSNPVTENNLGLVYFLRDRMETAAQHLQKALKLAPKFSDARNNYARVLIELGRYDEAITNLQAVIDDLTYDDPGKAWVNLGLVYFRKKDFPQARQKFAEAIRINRDHCLAQTLYGRSLMEEGRTQTAAAALDNAVVVCRASKYDEPYYYSGLAYYKLGQTSSAIARMEEIVKLYPHGTYAGKAESMLKLMR